MQTFPAPCFCAGISLYALGTERRARARLSLGGPPRLGPGTADRPSIIRPPPASLAAAANPAAGGAAPAGQPATSLRSLRRARRVSDALVSHCILQGQNETVEDGCTSPRSETSLNKNKKQTTTLQGKEFRVNKQSFSVK
ncbi:uncharacterized protein LOC118154465 isoform X2 [Callithrix jacchus]|uniref:uncharacterized protein LOC118154465 isoform X2 n=1 Tax=Callithrix jacchus TaxID=9483 RepID=UPI00159F6E1E|nr:uncharacterized protein LOC118154465 isoform X2 [Callithrix jacchus]